MLTREMTASEDRAVSLLGELGFQEYEAKCLVALLKRSEGTAAAISETADIPRSRVYDVADSLADRNLVEVQEGDPRRYRALRVEAVLEHIERGYRDRLDELAEVLCRLEAADCDDTDPGVWHLSGRSSITSRLQEFVTDAEDELVVLVTDDLLTEEYVETLETVADRGVAVTFIAHSTDLRSWLATRFPDARVVETPPILTQMPGDSEVAHLAFVDWSAVLMVSVTRATPAASPTFNATLIDGVMCGFVLMLRQLLGDALGAEASLDE